MIRCALLLLALFSGLVAHAQQPVVVRAWYPPGADARPAAHYGTPLAVDHRRSFVILETDAAGIAGLRDAGFHVVPDPSADDMRGKTAGAGGIPGYPCYPTFEETLAWIDDQIAAHPDLATRVDIGDSWEKTAGLGGHDLVVLRLTQSAAAGPKPVLFVMSGLHPREYSPGGLTTTLAAHLLDGYGRDGDATWLLDDMEVHLLFAANPDGRVLAEHGVSQRKNLDDDFCTGSAGKGVDLNRNMAFAWGYNSGCAGTSPCGLTFRGPGPASEPETDALQAYLRTIFPDQRGPMTSDPAPDDAMGVFVDLHSYGNQVLWPYGFDVVNAPNHDALTTLGRRLAYFNGFSPEKASASFDTCGATDDFAYGDLGVAAYTFEVGTSFFQSCATYEASLRTPNLNALLYAAKAARAPYLWPSGPNTEDLRASADTLLAGDPLRLVARVSDARFQAATHPPGTEPTQTVTAAAAFVDIPEWAAGTGLAFSAADGAFDAVTEQVEGQIDTGALAVGDHLIWLRGEDAGGQAGVPGAALLHVADPATHGTLSGQARVAGIGTPLAARLTTTDATGWSREDDGVFRMATVAGTRTVTASLDGYCDAFRTATVTAGATTDVGALSLLPDTAVFDQDDPSFWHAEGSWTLVPDGADLVWTDSPDAPYADDTDTSLVSDPYPATRGPVVLRFSHRYRLDAFGGDLAEVACRINDGPWQVLRTFHGDGGTGLHTDTVRVAAPRGAAVRFRFRLTSDAAFSDEGWTVGDLRLGTGTDCSLAGAIQAWPDIDVRDIIPLVP